MNYDTPSTGGALILLSVVPLEMNQGLGKANPKPWIKRLKEQLLIVEQHVDELCHVLDGHLVVAVNIANENLGFLGEDDGVVI